VNKLIVITGPTASGKTLFSIELADYIKHKLLKKVAIVNFDSLLFYQEINLGTAKPTLEERKDIDHYLIDIVSIKSAMNASDFVKVAKNKIDDLFLDNTIVILVGGSAFYLRALLKGMYESEKPTEAIKQEVDTIYNEKGISTIIEFLKIHDPESLKNLHENDHYRLCRAMIHFKMTGNKLSDQKKVLDDKDPYDFSKIEHPWKMIHFYLDLDKSKHFEIIQKRTRNMIQSGLIAEVQSLIDAGYSTDLKPLQSIGYKESIEFIQNKYPTIEDCIERIAISTRQLAKSQRTFFNKIHPKISIDPNADLKLFLEISEEFLTRKE